jgi:flagellar biosynthesis protein FlhB
MAQHDDKTEKPTGKRKQEARRKGQVAKSTDLNGALVLLAGMVAISSFGPSIVSGVADSMRSTFAYIARPGTVMSGSGLSGLLHAVLDTLLSTLAPVAAVCVGVGVLANVAQVGARPNLHKLKPDLKRLNPVSGFKNLFGPRVGFELAKTLAKLAAMGAVVATALIPQLTNLAASIGTSPGALGSLMSSNAAAVAQRAGVAYLGIAIIDYVWQRRRHNKSLKMSKHEVKEEGKQQDLPPEIKSAIRRRQFEAARRRMMAAVPKADVVVTNPTHFAVALSYDGSHPAPVVVAKGQDLVARQIRRIAEEHDVPIVPDPPLARSLHKAVEVGQMIPAELYAAVAQVLAFVYRMAGRRRARA